MSASPSVIKSSVAYDKIRDLILTGAKLPGTRLVIAELEEELQIGRGPIRDALMRLDKSGLIRILPYKGVIVAPPPTLDEIEQIYALRVQLEYFLACAAMARLTPEDTKRLDGMLDAMEDCDPAAFVTRDKAFHYAVYTASGLDHLCLLAEKIFESVEVFLRSYPPARETCKASLAEHRTMLRAIREKDVEILRGALAANINRGVETIRDGFARYVRL